MVAKEAAFIAAAGRKKKLGEHLLLTELTSLEQQPSFAQCKRPVRPAGRSRRRAAGVASRGSPLGVADGGGGRDDCGAPVPSKLSRSWLFSRAY